MEITIPEILTPAIAARLVANGYTGKMIFDLINYSRGIAAGTDEAIKANTVTKIFTNTLTAALRDQNWRKDEQCIARVQQFGSDVTTAAWNRKFEPKGAGGVPVNNKETDVPLTDLYLGTDPNRWPIGSAESWLTASLRHVQELLLNDPLAQNLMVSDLPAIILHLQMTVPESSFKYGLDKKRVQFTDAKMVEFWRSETNGLFQSPTSK
ncbi:hypothetical protein EJ08DRAFT_700685 [Tothia fuscella]|uniref:Uncharacterized protein n=1 Tax=Tothia fuscella TaxID=1048955 RepID=A0A9P4NKD7_9PEZI|nr:hypothetical protein EJ08DRAFT_700685 [Tothia fuscella]